MARVEFCECSQKGIYALGIISLASGELACKNCRGVIPPSDLSDELVPMPAPEPPQEATLPTTLEDLVDAQNRTTHAVRALAITLVAAPLISLAVIVVLALAVRSGNVPTVVITSIIGLLTLLGVLVSSLDELRRSRVN